MNKFQGLLVVLRDAISIPRFPWNTPPVAVVNQSGGGDDDDDLPPAAPRPRQTRPLAAVHSPDVPNITEMEKLVHTAGWSDRVKGSFVEFIAVFGAFSMWVLLGYGNGYFYAGLHELSWDTWVIIVYLFGGWGLEAIGMALIFVAGFAYIEKNYHKMVFALVFALILALVSFISQYSMLEAQVALGTLKVPNNAIQQIPFLVLFGKIGKGQTLLFVLRSAAFHIGEFACTFLIPKRKPDAAATIKRYQEYQTANQQLTSFRQYSRNLDTMHNSIHQVIDNQMQALTTMLTGVATNQPNLIEAAKTQQALDRQMLHEVQKPVDVHVSTTSAAPRVLHPTMSTNVVPPQSKIVPLRRSAENTPSLPTMRLNKPADEQETRELPPVTRAETFRPVDTMKQVKSLNDLLR
jgi:hypothetical protein